MAPKQYFVAFVFGLIGIFAFAPFSIKPLILISYAYLIRSILFDNTHTFKKLISWAIGHWGFGMSWLIVSVYYYGETSILISLVIFFLLTLFLTLCFGLPLITLKYRLFSSKVGSKHLKIFSISSLLILFELSRYYLLNGVPWLIPGTVFLDTKIQFIYSFIGVTGGSLIVYLVSTSIAIFWDIRYRIFLASLLLFIPNINNINDTEFDLKVSIIQPSSDPFQKYNLGYKSYIENNILDLVKDVSPASQIIVLPEAELPYSIKSNDFRGFVKRISKYNKDIIMGVWNYQDKNLYNSLINLSTQEIYNKQHLVPFGEYIPFISSLRGVIDFFDMPMSNVTKGSNIQENIQLNAISKEKFAPLICFDIAFGNTVRKANISSNFMINISNDTWFGRSMGPYQHLEITRIRAIENNKWVIRATNDGVSAIISNKGTIVDKIDKNVSGVLNSGINYTYNRTIYSHYGHHAPVIFALIVVLTSFIICLCTQRQKI
jgi:apolipoprotein N-acyltransferase